MTEEADLYPIIQAMFSGLGYSTKTEFGVKPYGKNEHGRSWDVFAYRWNGDKAEMAAVECKQYPPPAGILLALPQAIDMKMLVGETYIATPSGSGLGGVGVLDRLGIGFVEIRGGKAFKVTEPAPGKLEILDFEGHVQQVRSRAKLLLAWEDHCAGTKYRYGGLDSPENSWCALPLDGDVQQNIFPDKELVSVQSGLNLESKGAIRTLVSKWNQRRTADLAGALRDLPDDFRMDVWEEKMRPYETGATLISEHANKVRATDIDALIGKMRDVLARSHWKPHINIYRSVWPVEEDIGRGQAKNRLTEVRRDIDPLVVCLKS